MPLCRYGCGMLERIISGGQTGADQAGLAVAKRLGISTGGYMPKGWLTEAGPRPNLGATYGLEEAATGAYPDRTERNVLASDATVVFGDARSRGSMLTASLCRKHAKLCLFVPLRRDPVEAAHRLRAWIAEHDVRTLNVAGNRASQAPGIAAFVTAVLEQALGDIADQRGA
jgi:Circularly permutated YpsA SLOG family